MRQYDFHPEARAEYFASIDYYKQVDPDLGAAFVQEFEDAIELILGYPIAWPRLGADTRRCMMGRFPYGIIYSEMDDESILILAVAHAKREPGYWQLRKK